MLIGAHWWLKKWHKIHQPAYQTVFDEVEDESHSKTERMIGFSASMLYAIMTGLSPAIIIGSSPYYSMYAVSSELSLGWRTATHAPGGLLVHSTGVSNWIDRGVFKHGLRSRAVRIGAAKVGARLIPGLGWGLLAYDVYSLAKRL